MKWKWLFRGLLIITTVLLLMVIWLRVQIQRQAALPIMFDVPEFSLIEASGKPITLADLKGQVWVAAFIFTRCGTICPRMSTAMSELPPGNYRLVSFSVDPVYDTPAVLTEYAKRYQADPQRWSFVTGDKAAIRGLATTGFRLTAEDAAADDNEPILHSSHLVLVDRQGRIRGYYDGTSADEIARLTKDLRRL